MKHPPFPSFPLPMNVKVVKVNHLNFHLLLLLLQADPEPPIEDLLKSAFLHQGLRQGLRQEDLHRHQEDHREDLQEDYQFQEVL